MAYFLGPPCIYCCTLNFRVQAWDLTPLSSVYCLPAEMVSPASSFWARLLTFCSTVTGKGKTLVGHKQLSKGWWGKYRRVGGEIRSALCKIQNAVMRARCEHAFARLPVRNIFRNFATAEFYEENYGEKGYNDSMHRRRMPVKCGQRIRGSWNG